MQGACVRVFSQPAGPPCFMKRLAERRLENWFGRDVRPPMFLYGQRGVGKTRLLREFGREKFKRILFFDLRGDAASKEVFSGGGAKDAAAAIASFAGYVPDSETLIILDNVRESSAALEFLRLSPKLIPGAGVIGAGTLPERFECKDIELLELHPMCFREFLLANGEEALAKTLEGCTAVGVLGKAEEFERWMRLHICVGGLPEAVKCYSETRDLNAAHTVNRAALDLYANGLPNFPSAPFFNMNRNFWHLLSDHFGGEYQKFGWGNIRLGKCAHFYEKALPWITGCGLGAVVENLCDLRADFPSAGKKYKVYCFDTGLLCAMRRESPPGMLCGSACPVGFQAAEHYVLNEIKAHAGGPVFYSGNDRNELVSFIVSCGGELVPVEVNPFDNLKIGCLDRYLRKHSACRAVRACMREFRKCAGICKVPMYAVGHFLAGLSD